MFSCRCFCFVLLSIVNCDSLEIEICPEPPFFFLSPVCDSLAEDLITDTHLEGERGANAFQGIPLRHRDFQLIFLLKLLKPFQVPTSSSSTLSDWEFTSVALNGS